MDEIPTNICGQCRRAMDSVTTPVRESNAEGCGHTVYSASPEACYCDHCAYQRGVCAICGNSMSVSRPSPDGEDDVPTEDLPHNGSRSVVALIILFAVVMLVIAIVMAIGQC